MEAFGRIGAGAGVTGAGVGAGAGAGAGAAAAAGGITTPATLESGAQQRRLHTRPGRASECSVRRLRFTSSRKKARTLAVLPTYICILKLLKETGRRSSTGSVSLVFQTAAPPLAAALPDSLTHLLRKRRTISTMLRLRLVFWNSARTIWDEVLLPAIVSDALVFPRFNLWSRGSGLDAGSEHGPSAFPFDDHRDSDGAPVEPDDKEAETPDPFAGDRLVC
jgi:hypothetical protein